jgi:hypothetical protein
MVLKVVVFLEIISSLLSIHEIFLSFYNILHNGTLKKGHRAKNSLRNWAKKNSDFLFVYLW